MISLFIIILRIPFGIIATILLIIKMILILAIYFFVSIILAIFGNKHGIDELFRYLPEVMKAEQVLSVWNWVLNPYEGNSMQ